MRRAVILFLVSFLPILFRHTGVQASLLTPITNPEISIAIHGNMVIYRGPSLQSPPSDNNMITSELVKSDGTRIDGYGVISETGAAEIVYGGIGTAITSGDRLLFGGLSFQVATIDIPLIYVDYDINNGAIFGAVPAGYTPDLTIHSCDLSWKCIDTTDTINTAPDGTFHEEMSKWMDVNVMGSLVGNITINPDPSITISDSFAMLGVTLDIGTDEISGVASAGSHLHVSAISTAGARILDKADIIVASDGKWQLLTDKAISPSFGLKIEYSNPVSNQQYAIMLTAEDIDIRRDNQRLLLDSHEVVSGRAVRIVGKSSRLGLREDFPLWDTNNHLDYHLADLTPEVGPFSLRVETMKVGVITRYSQVAGGLRFLLGTGFVSGAAGDGEDIKLLIRDHEDSSRTNVVRIGHPAGYLGYTFDDVVWTTGDKIQVDSGQGDPDAYSFPPISIHYDVERRVLAGDSAPYARVIITVRGGSSPLPRTIVSVANWQGQFVASVEEFLFPGKPIFGTAEVESKTRYSTYVAWMQPWIEYQLGGGTISISRPDGKAYKLSVTDHDGRAMLVDALDAGHRDLIDNTATSMMNLDLNTNRDEYLTLEPEGGVSLVVSGEKYSWMIPTIISTVASGNAKLVSTMPIVRGVLCGYVSQKVQKRCIDGALGTSNEIAFAIGEAGITPDSTTVELVGETQTLHLTLATPSLSVNYDTGVVDLYRSSPVGGPYRLMVTRQEKLISSELFATNRDGEQSITGDIQFGDQLQVIDEAGRVIVSDTAPKIHVDSVQGGRVVGWVNGANVSRVAVKGMRATDQSDIRSRVFQSQAISDIREGGRFELLLVPERDYSRASLIYTAATTVSGDVFILRHITPLIFVEYGGSTVCGYSGQPGTQVLISHRNGSDTEASHILADETGRFETQFDLRHPIIADDEISVLTEGISIQMRVPAVTAHRASLRGNEFDFRGIGGSGPIGTRYFYLRGDLCTDIETIRTTINVTDKAGKWAVFDGDSVMAQENVIMFGNGDDGAFVAKKYVWSGMRVFPYQGAIEIVASPWTQAHVIANDESGNQRGEVTIQTGGSSVARGRVGGGVPLQVGDVVSLMVDGIEAVSVIPDVWVDWSVKQPIVGSSTKPQDTQLYVRFADGKIKTIVPQWTETTRFTVSVPTIRQIEQEAGSDIVGIRAIVVVGPMTEVIVQTDEFDAARPGLSLYLPFLARRR